MAPTRSALRCSPFLLTTLAMILLMLPMEAGAQPAPAIISLNAWSCPQGYDEISNCMKLDGVSVRIFEDGDTAGDLTSVSSASADLEVAAGSGIFIEMLGGAPANSLLEPMAHQFGAVEGTIPLSMVFVIQNAPQEQVDTDGDGVTDAEEASLGTDPNKVNSDDDGVQDGGELNTGTDPLDPDTDGDGFIDRVEMDLQTDPLDPAHFPTEAEPNSLTVTAYNCPAGYAGKDLFTDCTEPAIGVDFVLYLNGSEFGLTGRTNAAGTVSFNDFGGGVFTLQEDLDDLGMSLQRFTAICVAEPLSQDAPEPRQVDAWPLEDGAYGFELTAGEEISCTWFNIPAEGRTEPGPEPTKAPASPTTPASPVKQLPSTGSGSAEAAISDNAALISCAIATLSLLSAGAAWHTRRRV